MNVQHLYISIYCTVDFLHISQPWSSSLFFAGGNRWQWSRRKIKHDSTLLQGHFYEELQENYRCRFPRKTHHVRWLLLLEKFVYFPFKSKHFEIIWMKLAENIFHNNAKSGVCPLYSLTLWLFENAQRVKRILRPPKSFLLFKKK